MHRVIALLGRKDEPTDAVEEYCRYLGSALTAHGISLEIQRLPWEKRGWSRAFAELRESAVGWRGSWVLLQYTALAWSARGVPHRFLSVIKRLKTSGARIAIVFHDVEPYSGYRAVDRFRRAIQIRTMRRALLTADIAIFTVPTEKLSWLIQAPSNAVFIAVGPNLPIPSTQIPVANNAVPTVGVFGITGGEAGERETNVIISSVSEASKKLGRMRLRVFGRHAELRELVLRRGLRNLSVDLSVEGVVKPEDVVQKLSACDLLLFVRGAISSRRSSAIAGVACGLPVIAFAGQETASPVTEAGVMLIPREDSRLIATAVVQFFTDPSLRAELAARSRSAYLDHFAWPAIASRFAKLLFAK